MLTWYPDTCSGCSIEINNGDFVTPKRIISLCPHHQSVKNTNNLTDNQVFESIVQSNRVRETARYAAKTYLKLDKEHPGVPYRIEADGSFTIGIDQLGSKMAEWPSSKRELDKLQAVISEAVLSVERPIGTSEVKI